MSALLRPLRPIIFLLALVTVWAVAAPAAAAPSLPAPAGWPVAGPARVVGGFDPPAVRWGAGHRGVDLAASRGDPVLAAAAGTVHFAGRVGGKPVVSIDHGGVRTTYEPVQAMVLAGQRVSMGQLIGRVSSGGHCGQRCLHWGLRDGPNYLNPLLLIRAGDARLRLVAEARRGVVIREARARAEAAAAAAEAGTFVDPAGPAGSHGFIHPVSGGVTSRYGMRFHPVLKRWKLHDGTDFGAACGTAIRAPYARTRLAGVLQCRLRPPAVPRARPGRRGLGTNRVQSRHPVCGASRPARTPRPGDRVRGQHRLFDRMPSPPDGLAERQDGESHVLVLTNTCPEPVEGAARPCALSLSKGAPMLRPADAPARTPCAAARW